MTTNDGFNDSSGLQRVVAAPNLEPGDRVAVRDLATVIVGEPFQGTRHRKPAAFKGRASAVVLLKVDPRVMAAAKTAMVTGQRIVVVSAAVVGIVNQ